MTHPAPSSFQPRGRYCAGALQVGSSLNRSCPVETGQGDHPQEPRSADPARRAGHQPWELPLRTLRERSWRGLKPQSAFLRRGWPGIHSSHPTVFPRPAAPHRQRWTTAAPSFRAAGRDVDVPAAATRRCFRGVGRRRIAAGRPVPAAVQRSLLPVAEFAVQEPALVAVPGPLRISAGAVRRIRLHKDVCAEPIPEQRGQPALGRRQPPPVTVKKPGVCGGDAGG